MTNQLPSLLDSLPAAAAARPRPWWRIELRIPDGARRWWGFRMADPARKRTTLRAVWIGGSVLAVALAAGAWLVFGPRFQPDYDSDPLDDVFDYTMLSDEFNRLPVEERLRLMGQLVERLKGMSAEDSVLLAAFASGIAGEARAQIERNISLLAIDVWDKYAMDYDTVPLEDRPQYLEETFVKFTKMMEAVAGEPREISDEERIAEVKRQADRDRKWLRENPGRGPDGESLGRVFSYVNGNVGGNANPQQRARGQLMLRDMARQFRGQDVATGKPKGPG